MIYCYATEPIDIFFGAMSNDDLARMARKGVPDEAEEAVDQMHELKIAAEPAFRQLGWEGDNQDGPRYFVVPTPEDYCLRIGVIYKQSNNGICFIASPVEMPHLGTAKVVE